MKTKKQNLIIFGIQGSGKGTQAKILAKDLGIPHISTGDMLREEAKKNTERGKFIRSLIEKGNLVPDEIITEMLKERLSRPDAKGGVILDGYPRNLNQAKLLDEICEVSKAIYLNISDEEAMERALWRRTCPKCGKIYHLKFSPPKNENLCDECGVALVWREDDKEEAIKIRLAKFHEQTEPLIDFYKKKDILVEIDGVGAIEEVARRIKNKV